MDIIERTSGVSDFDMWVHCELLKKILDQKKERKVGRGKAVQTILVNKYPRNKHYYRIENSCRYYKEKYMENKKSIIEFRDYQLDIIERGTTILKAYGFLYLAMEVRTGKTLTALGVADNIKPNYVLFVTKKKAISSIVKDYEALAPNYILKVINYESLHTVMDMFKWDVIVLDEAHSLGAFPKPSKRADLVRQAINKCNPKVILLSGTPTPESYSQMYHQVYAIKNNPFSHHKTFYRFCNEYVNVSERVINGRIVRDYSNGKQSILDAMRPYTINYTQVEAGFKGKINEHFLYVTMSDMTYSLIDKLKKDLVIEGKNEVVLADTPVKLMTKVHQLCSGTVKFESGASTVIDRSKAEFIKEYFSGKKIGIFYKFSAELEALKEVFDDSLTTELDEFDNTDKHIALQILSGREGVSLRNADCLVFYNIDFSATSYWQARDRMTTKDRPENDVYWVFAADGIEKEVYKAVNNKKDFTTNHFKKLLL